MNRIEELTLKLVDGSLSLPEGIELEELLQASRENREAHLKLLKVEAALRGRRLELDLTASTLERVRREIAETVESRVMRELRSAGPVERKIVRIPRPQLRMPARVLAMAACLTLAALLAWYFTARVGSPVLAELSGSVQIERAGHTLAADRGAALFVGDVLRTSATGAVAITFAPERTIVRLPPSTELRLVELSRGKRFFLATGSLKASVARQRIFQPLIIDTPAAEARVLGTRLTLEAGANSSRLAVEEGKVLFTRLADGASVRVAAGEYALVAPAAPLAHLPATGTISREWWNGVSWHGASESLDDPRFPGKPDGRDLASRFEFGPVETNQFGLRFRGFVHPPETGEYEFWLAAAPEAQLFLSPTDQPSRKVLIASAYSATAPRGWDTPQRGGSLRSGLISMEAGRRYYIEAILAAPEGEAHLSVAWKRPGAPRELLDGRHLSPADSKGKGTK